MEVKNSVGGVVKSNNINVSKVNNEPSSAVTQVPKELLSSKASMAARAYAMPQINFEGKYSKMLAELKSSKASDKIKFSFDDASTFLQKLGFTDRGGKGSHCNFVKDGSSPVTIARPHGSHNTVQPYIIDYIRDFVEKNNVTNI